MVQTRDFLLFVLLAGFLLLAILATYSAQSFAVTDDTAQVALLASQPVSNDFSVDQASSTSRDRESVRNRLREKIAHSSYTATFDPSVTIENVPQELEDEQGEITDQKVSLTRCAYVDQGLNTLQSWPREQLVWFEDSQFRYLEEPSDSMGSAVVVLPVSPYARSEPYCLDSEIVGVSQSGSLIFNADAAVYADTGEERFIGYARDGYPIHGHSAQSVDVCGGYQHPLGYRYVLSSERNFMIGCFRATPQPLR